MNRSRMAPALLLAAAAASADHEIIPIDPEIVVCALNNVGQVVGYDSGDPQRAVLWENGEITLLPPLPGLTESRCYGLNDQGWVVGISFTEGVGQRATMWRNGEVIDLGGAAASSSASGVNGLGQAVGSVKITEEISHAALFENGQVIDIGVTWPDKRSGASLINDAGVMVGTVIMEPPGSGTYGTFSPFKYENGVAALLWDPAWDYWQRPADINADGVIVGYTHGEWLQPGSPTFRQGWLAGSVPFAPLPPIGGNSSHSAFGLNDHGDAVGYLFTDPGQYTDGAIWIDGVGALLQDLLPPGSGWSISAGSDINNRGQIIGRGHYQGVEQYFLMSPIIVGDVNGDFVVDVLDLLEVLAAWGPCPGCPADLNGDGVVNVLDLLEVLANWSP